MKVSFSLKPSSIVFEILPNDKEMDKFDQFVNKRSFSYTFEDTLDFVEPHPDKMALVAILNLLPFSIDELSIGWGVSSEFSSAAKIITRAKVNFKHTNHLKGKHLQNGLPSLAFSGGADSTAALCMMPIMTDCVFHKRSESPSKTLYDDHAALTSCKKIKMLGYKVHIVESDFEYLRKPVGFPTDLSVGTPAILLSDSRNYSSVAYGTILESAFGTSGEKYREYGKSSHYKLWSNLFFSAGLYYSLPIAGVSEVGSTLICKKHPIGKVHQSCIRGKWAQPCQDCWKCYRKEAISAALDERKDFHNFDFINRIKSSREVRSKILCDSVIKHEGVLTYSLERAPEGNDECVNALKMLARVGIIETEWMEKWYQDSQNLIDPSYRDEAAQKLSRTLGVMSKNEVDSLTEWKNYNSPERSRILKRLKHLISNRQ